jgi:hypothetical protein
MDYLERNIKDSYSQKTTVIDTAQTKGSTITFFVCLIFWTVAVIAWKLM